MIFFIYNSFNETEWRISARSRENDIMAQYLSKEHGLSNYVGSYNKSEREAISMLKKYYKVREMKMTLVDMATNNRRSRKYISV